MQRPSYHTHATPIISKFWVDAAVVIVTPLRDFFALSLISPLDIAIALSGAAITAAGLWILDRRFRPEPLRGSLPRWMARMVPRSMRADDD